MDNYAVTRDQKFHKSAVNLGVQREFGVGHTTGKAPIFATDAG